MTGRFDGLDRVRAGAMLLGVVYHATYAFIPDVGPWFPVQARATSTVFVAVAGVIHAVRMPVFFALSGFFAALVLDKRGAGFLGDRFRRLMVPFFVATPLSVMADTAIRRLALREGVMDARYDVQGDWVLRPLHLWFLEYLFLFCLAAWLLSKTRLTARLDGLFARAPEVLVAGGLLTFGAQHFVGEPQPAFSFAPQVASLLAFGPFFALGWALHRARTSTDALTRRAWPMVLAALVTCLVVFTRPLQWQPPGQALAAVAAWLMTLGVMGLALRPGSRSPGLLVQSAYWVYLVHHPLVQLGQVLVARREWPVWLSYGAVVLGTFAVSFGSYALVVRHTPLAGWLGSAPGHQRASKVSERT
ncbi:MAG: acyltransferase family protein [Myxococcaceae bacterium]|nr:acyltransferase family protein [Myxococcaceae bacterium]